MGSRSMANDSSPRSIEDGAIRPGVGATRRQVLTTLMACAGLPFHPGSAWAAPTSTVLRAAPGTWQLAPAGQAATPVWSYGESIPGPTLRLRQGERVRCRLENRLPEQATTIHWHGIRLINGMDGVPGLTQAAVPPGEVFDYDFVAPDAGTYWYHAHERSWEQVARGLHGVLVVEEPEPPDVDEDIAIAIDDWRLSTDATLRDDFGAMHDRAHAGRVGNWVTANGAAALTVPARRNTRLRLRLVNTANGRIFSLSTQGLDGWIVALDGQPLDKPAPFERVVLGPAQRADLIVDVTGDPSSEAFLVSHERDGGYALVTFSIGEGARARRADPPRRMTPNPVPVPTDLAGARRSTLEMTGGAMGRMASARFEGKDREIRELVRHGMAWAMNGTAGMTPEPLLDLSRGETTVIRLVNDTAWPHAMHLHGHHFSVLGENGEPGPLRDTVLVDRGETREIAFVADNPGKWLIHCHMLEHAAAGMTTWIRVGA